jgi:signal transduction histidine kinase/ligand-binding sensor domain-containing protein
MRLSRNYPEIRRARVSRFGRTLVGVAARATLIVIAAHTFGAGSFAQKLALPHYDVSDGLVSSNIHSIYQDRRGFLWFGTNDGLSRFDGYRFVNYGKRDGLPNTDINSVVEDRQGRIWIATNGGGIARLLNDSDDKATVDRKEKLADANAKFITVRVGDSQSSNRVNKILFDSHELVWCLTDAGVFRANTIDNEFSFNLFITDNAEAQAAIEDTAGTLWFGLQNDLVKVEGGRVDHFTSSGKPNNVHNAQNYIVGIAQEPNRNLLIAREHGLYEFTPPTDSIPHETWRELPLVLNASQAIQAVLLDSRGVVWVGTPSGLIKYQNGHQTTYAAEQGLSVDYIRSIYADRTDNLWIGSGGGGVYNIPNETVVSYTQEMGLPHAIVSGVVEDALGHIFAAYTYSPAELVELDGSKIQRHAELSVLPSGGHSELFTHDNPSNTWSVLTPFTGGFMMKQPILELRNGRRVNVTQLFPGKAPKRVCVYEDDSGGLWFDSDNKTIYRADAANPNPHVVKGFEADFDLTEWGGYPLMMTDHDGGLWLGGVERLARLWHGEFHLVSSMEGLAQINPLSFFVDSRGWFWIGSRNGGIAATREPGAEHPKFVNYHAEPNLSSDSVYSITEDKFGRMYFATTRGLDRFDPKTNEWRHFTTKDGLAGNRVLQLRRDRNGNIWAATSAGVSKLDPTVQASTDSAAPIYFSRINVAGEELPLPELGANQISKIELPSTRDNMSIEFFGVQFKGEDSLRYQYRLESADTTWSEATKNRTVTYAHLAPGNYRFAVRAVTEAGVVSAQPAEIEFRILQPIWRRGWFLAPALAAFLLVIYGIYRYRVTRLIEVERIRMRIATDLHDDIGANLSLIAMVSDMARGNVRPADTDIAGRLALIANTSRATMDSMSDIVWAVNPNKDQVGDLTQRMRRVADDIFTTNNIEYALRAPDSAHDRSIAADTRREVFMIFKEALNNIARHSRCTRAEIEFGIESGRLEMRLTDDGQGFDLAANSGGSGLASMRRRAANVGGTFEILSRCGAGTTIILKAPISGAAHSHVAG